MNTQKSYREIENELNELRFQLEEANETIDAIRSGEIDALVVKNKDGLQLYTLKNADQTYRIFIEQMTEGAVTLNQKNIILYCNLQFASMVQQPLEKVLGKSFYKFLDTCCNHDFEVLVEKAWAGKAKGEIQLLANNQQSVSALLSLKTLSLDEGLSMSIIVTDLTAQKQTQQLLEQKNCELEDAQKIAQQLNIDLENKVKDRTKELESTIHEKTKIGEDLRSQQNQLKLILETMAEGVGIIDIEGKIVYANPMAEKILGLKKSEILMRTFYDSVWTNLRINGTPLPGEEHPMNIMMATGKPIYDYEISVQPPRGERFYISINAAPLHNQNGGIIGGVSTFMDVSNRRKAIQQKDEFISIASHELKTPMTTLKASLQLLGRIISTDTHSPNIPVLLSKAGINLNRLSDLIDELLNVSRLEEGHLILTKSWFKMYAAVKANLDTIQLSGDYTITINGDKEMIVFADKHRIEQVIVNLVNNAVKYSPKSKRIDIFIKQEENAVQVAVQDFGIGIPVEKQAHLFNRYYRVDYSGNQYSGLGLGLYISSEIVKKHEGAIGVKSRPGEGSTFWFTLPIEKV